MCEMCLGRARRLVVRPGPAPAHGHRSPAPSPPINFARNSPAACSNIEFASLELQRFRAVSKNDRGKLCATFAGVVIAVTLDPLMAAGAASRSCGSSVPSTPVAVGVFAALGAGCRRVAGVSRL